MASRLKYPRRKRVDWTLVLINAGIAELSLIAGGALLLLYFVSIALGGQ